MIGNLVILILLSTLGIQHNTQFTETQLAGIVRDGCITQHPDIEGSDFTTPTPLSQLHAGIDIHQIICCKDYKLIIKFEDLSPACVTSHTFTVLLERGWGGIFTTSGVPP